MTMNLSPDTGMNGSVRDETWTLVLLCNLEQSELKVVCETRERNGSRENEFSAIFAFSCGYQLWSWIRRD
jgi:hypothetical protein